MITIFLHLPRTGGTTLTELIVQKEDVWRVSEAITDLLGTVRGTTVWGFDVLVGHVSWGVHLLLPKGEAYQYATMLRDPVERVASTYCFYRSREEWSETNLKWKWMAESTSLRTFARAPYAELDNAQVRQIAGMQMTGECCEKVTQEDLDLAIEHLSEFGWVGLTERFDESVERLGAVMGWDSIPDYGHSNPSNREPLDEETARVIRELNWADVKLYEFARKRLDGYL